MMERHGITRAGLKVVPHGLRHQDAADAYRSMTGQPPLAPANVWCPSGTGLAKSSERDSKAACVAL